MRCALLKTELFSKYFLDMYIDVRYKKNVNPFKFQRMHTFCTVRIQKSQIQKCALLKICKPIFSLYLRNEKKYRKTFCGYEIHEKRSICGQILAKI